MAGAFIFRWFASRVVREAFDTLRRARTALKAQSDLLPSASIEAVQASCHELNHSLKSGASNAEVKAKAVELEKMAGKHLRGHSYPAIREQIDVLLVALTVAMAVRTFFFQPMAIPTGSMQPTLYGITHEDLRGSSTPIPGFFGRFVDKWVKGVSYVHIVAQADGVLKPVPPAIQVFPFVKKQTFTVGPVTYTIWFPPDQLFEEVNRSGLAANISAFKKGDDIIKLKVRAGDRLFADRFTYNFRRPTRGEIIIFETTGIPKLTQNTHYIKRLVGLPGETIQITDDRHVLLNGTNKLTASTPRFENIYSFKGPPVESQYSGHVNEKIWREIMSQKYDLSRAHLDPTYFPDGNATYSIPPDQYFALGDNTMSSFDSRYWGGFPKEKVIGKCGFVFWPFSERFGWGIQ